MFFFAIYFSYSCYCLEIDYFPCDILIIYHNTQVGFLRYLRLGPLVKVRASQGSVALMTATVSQRSGEAEFFFVFLNFSLLRTIAANGTSWNR